MVPFDVASVIFCPSSLDMPSPSHPPLDDKTFKKAITACLKSHPVDGLCNDGEFGPMPGWDTSKVTNMELAFFNADGNNFNADIIGWNTSRVTSMYGMVAYCRNFNQPIADWDTSKVTTVKQMFEGAVAFDQDITGWSTPPRGNSRMMFMGATAFVGKFKRSGNSADGPPSLWTPK